MALSLGDDLPRAVSAQIRMDAIGGMMRGCRRCSLCEGPRRNVVFGAGNPSAAIMIVNSNTNGYEDKDAKPLAGPPGELVLRCVLEQGLLPRQDLYVTSALKCLAPHVEVDGERRRKAPGPAEIAACTLFLREQIAIVRPAIVLIHGRTANEILLEDPRPLNKYAGHMRTFGDSCIAVSTHNYGRIGMDEGGLMLREYRGLWGAIAARLHCLGRMWRPDADVFKRGWTPREVQV